MNQPSKPFARRVESLGECTLGKGVSDGDAARIGELLAAIDPWRALGSSPAALARYLRRDDPALNRYVVRPGDGGEIAGVVCVRYPWLRGPYIELLGLADRHQGQGIGRRILQWAETEARRESRNLWVVTSAFNHQARRFYRRHGFYEVGPLNGLVDPGQDEILLRKSWD